MDVGERSAWERYKIESFSPTAATMNPFDVRVGGCIKSQELVDLLGL